VSKIDLNNPIFSYKHNSEDIARLKLSLSESLKEAKITLKKDKPVRILNLACGRSDETGILLDMLAPSPEACEFIGIDIRSREIAEANERWNKLTEGNANFLVHDGTKINEIEELGGGFDYAFMRHQNFWNADLTWFKIYDNALHMLKPEGLLIITSYFDHEHLLALKAIQSLGAKLILTWQNPRTRMIDVRCKKSTDRHIAIFRLPSLSTSTL